MEGGEAFGGFGLDGYVVDGGQAGAGVGPVDQAADVLGRAFEDRLDHQVEQLRHGSVPDDFIDPKTLNPLARSYLREAFRAVASVQANLSAELSLGVRWG